MQAVKARITKALNVGSIVETCDNSGAKIVRVLSVKRHKTRKGRIQSGGVGNMITISVKKGVPGMRKQIFPAVIVRQRKEYRRPDGTRIKFEDNAVVVCKDDKGNPKGTMLKGPIAKEACAKWPAISKLARIIV